MRREYIAVLLGSALGVAACSTPSLTYNARLPAGDVEASAYRDVGVYSFRGPEGDWFASRLEQMLTNATLDGQPWFSVATETAPAPPDGVYSGSVSIDDVDVHEWTQSEKKCVEWDGLFDCETRAEVEQFCEEIDVDVSVTVQLSDSDSGRAVFSNTYSGDASERECWDIGIVGEKHGYHSYGGLKRQHFSGWGFGFDYAPPELVREALSETIGRIRNDIAPRNARVKAPLVAEAIDTEAGADTRFALAVDAASDGQLEVSCGYWDGLLADYPNAPGVRHNAGACAEARGDYTTAQSFYAEAVSQMQFHPLADDGHERILKSLERISGRRSGEAILDELTGAAGRLPVPDVEPGS